LYEKNEQNENESMNCKTECYKIKMWCK